MKYLKIYRIPFSGLSNGKHEFVFDIDKKFFDCYEYSIVKDGDLKVAVTLDKQAHMMLADIRITGTIRLTCDVCLREFDRETEIRTQLVIKFSDEDLTEITDEILVLTKNEYEFSIADVLYEHINVSVPLYVRCDEQSDGGGCDQQMIAILNGLAPKQQEDSMDQPVDPRWEMLERLKKNN